MKLIIKFLQPFVTDMIEASAATWQDNAGGEEGSEIRYYSSITTL